MPTNAAAFHPIRLTVEKLPVEPGPGVCLYCERCAEQFSAQRSDYFFRDRGCSLRCLQCNSLLRLVRARVVLDRITPEEAELG